MIALLQRVTKAQVVIDNKLHAEIGKGYVILLGITHGDSEQDIDKLINKIIHLRIMADNENKMNKSILEVAGEILVVSQFTLHADVRKGRRPSFIKAMNPSEAQKLYELFIIKLRDHLDQNNLRRSSNGDLNVNSDKKNSVGLRSSKVKSGIFSAMMEVQIFNDGPVTLMIDSTDLSS